MISHVKNIRQFKDVYHLDEGIMAKTKTAIFRPARVTKDSSIGLSKRTEVPDNKRFRLTNCSKLTQEKRKVAGEANNDRLLQTSIRQSLADLRIRRHQDPLHRDIVAQTKKVIVNDTFKTMLYGFTVKRTIDPNLSENALLQPVKELIEISRTVDAARRLRHQKEIDDPAKDYLRHSMENI